MEASLSDSDPVVPLDQATEGVDIQPSTDERTPAASTRPELSLQDIAYAFAHMWVDVKNRDPDALSLFRGQAGPGSELYGAYLEKEDARTARLINVEYFMTSDEENDTDGMGALNVFLTTVERPSHIEFDVYLHRSFELRPQQANHSASFYVHDESCDILTMVDRDSAPLTASELARLHLNLFPSPPLSRSAPDDGVSADLIGLTFARAYIDVMNRCPDQLGRFWVRGQSEEIPASAYGSFNEVELVYVTAYFDLVRRKGSHSLRVFMVTSEMCPQTKEKRMYRRRFVLDPFEAGDDRYAYCIVEEAPPVPV